jgi:hypothetical protein
MFFLARVSLKPVDVTGFLAWATHARYRWRKCRNRRAPRGMMPISIVAAKRAAAAVACSFCALLML